MPLNNDTRGWIMSCVSGIGKIEAFLGNMIDLATTS